MTNETLVITFCMRNRIDHTVAYDFSGNTKVYIPYNHEFEQVKQYADEMGIVLVFTPKSNEVIFENE